MIVSRSLPFLRRSTNVARNCFLQNKNHNLGKQITRNGHGGQYFYRRVPDATPAAEKVGNLLGGIMWWWVVWHFLTDYHEIIGGSPFPDPATWTDEELGIPPENED